MSKLIQRTVYFREEDIPQWDALDNKAAWLHDKLQGAPRKVQGIPNKVEELFLPTNPKRTTDPGWSGPLHRNKKSGRL